MTVEWAKLEDKWQRAWESAKLFECNPDPGKKKFYLTVAYPYPNSPQHIGHGRTYTLTDVYARYLRMRGYNVLFPMAFHYTGTPILAMAKRLAQGDKELTETFTKIYQVPREELKEFTEPIKIARYFHEEIKKGMKEIGYSIDWRREFTTIDGAYQKFIEWQFRKLREAGFISQGSHPVGWCPNCGNPVGQHDTKGDVEPEIEEYTLIKFKLIPGGAVLPTATLRAETLFGVTNLWLNPEAEYVEAEVDGEKWIVSKRCAEKLEFQSRTVRIIKNLKGKELIGSEVINPVNNERILVLPAEFVDPNNATGAVMSVPGHAPYDYVALENLKRNYAMIEAFNLKREIIEGIKPISVIEVPGYSELPAADVVEKMEIRDQKDSRLEEATKIVYRAEFHNGKMRENTGSYAGLSVSEGREKIKGDLVKKGKADSMYELSNRPVICRCGTECIVKMFEDQWFINYNDPKWKELAHKCVERMKIIPKELRSEFDYVIDWLHEKACARKSGLGTKLPWAKEWIIESLSDSVIYMAYYTIARWIKEQRISPEKLNDEVFDYIFLSRGDPEEVSRSSGLNRELLEEMHREFLYFYPLDSRHSGRDLIPNHLTFMIFIHTAIFPEEHWPRQIVINGSVLMEGQKMSKSLGNIIPLRNAIETFGADPIRIAVLGTAELLQDADFSPTVAKSIRERLERFLRFVQDTAKSNSEAGRVRLTMADKWMLSRLQRHIKAATEAMEELSVRRVIQITLYLLDQDLQWYNRRTVGERADPERVATINNVLRTVLDAQIRMLSPMAPHICEEAWSLLGKEGFVSTSSWPEPDDSLINMEVELGETLVRQVLEDTQNILKVTGITPKRIVYYVSSPWRWKTYLTLLEKMSPDRRNLGEIMKELMKDPELKSVSRKVAKFVGSVQNDLSRTPPYLKETLIRRGTLNEKDILEKAKNFLERELKAKVDIYEEEDPQIYDPAKRAHLTKPMKPAIYVEG